MVTVTAPMIAPGQPVTPIAAIVSLPSLVALWQVLESVPDPEIPVVSVVKLGIVRGLAWDDDEPGTLVVRVTPTYSGCPATELIATDIRSALTAAGVPLVRLEIQLAPAWTTDWMAPEARAKLREYGIAPPGGSASGQVRIDVSGLRMARRAAVAVACPRCGSERTRVLSQFGSTACKAQYRCDACLEPFDYFKPH
jgi:ring-1,2-phenylacetyl-CoA epoxidase subunit PaaD